MQLSRRKSVAALIALCILGFLVRIYSLGDQSLWIDEGYSLNAAQSVIERGVPVLDSGALYSNGPLSVYAIALSEKLFSFDPFHPWPARLPAVLAGTGLIAASFFLARRFFTSEAVALSSAFLVAFAEWGIAWSRQARGYMLLSLFACLCFIFLDRYLSSKKPKELIVSGLFLGAAYLSHGVGIIFLPAFLIILLRSAFTARSRFLDASVFFAAALGIIAVSFYGPFDTSAFKENYLMLLPISVAIFSCVALVGFVLSFFDAKSGERAFMLCVFAFIPITEVFFLSPVVQIRYLVPVFPLLIILSVYAAWRIGALLSERNTLRALPVVALVAASVPLLSFIPRAEYRLEVGSPQPDFSKAFQMVLMLKKDGDVVISPYTQLHKVYLGEKGMWLRMGLNNRPGEMQKRVVNGVDYYVGAPVIIDLPAFQNVVETKSGFVVLDSMAVARLPDIYAFVRRDRAFTEVFQSGTSTDRSRITVYRF